MVIPVLSTDDFSAYADLNLNVSQDFSTEPSLFYSRDFEDNHLFRINFPPLGPLGSVGTVSAMLTVVMNSGIFTNPTSPGTYTATGSFTSVNPDSGGPDNGIGEPPKTLNLSQEIAVGQGPSPPPGSTSGGNLVNISTRGMVGTGDEIMIGGLIIDNASVDVLVRARGPSLEALGVLGTLSDPTLQLFTGPNPIAENNDWQDSPQAGQIQTTMFGGESLAPDDPKESAILMTLSPGRYTVHVTGIGGSTGVAIVEVFKVGGTGELINISTRGRVGTPDDVMIGGLVIENSQTTLLIRARGPVLATFGVPGTLLDPTLQLFSGPTSIAENDNWQSSPDAAQIQALMFEGESLAPTDPSESALLMTLDPGEYTAQVRGVGGSTGVAIVEVNEISSP
jgi:hypothetical protein